MKPMSTILASAAAAGMLLLGNVGCSPTADGDGAIETVQGAVLGVDQYLYLTCNATSWQPNNTSRVQSTSDPTVFTVDIDVRQSYMVSGNDDCQLTLTNQKDGWGTSQTRYTTRDTTVLNVPGSSRLLTSTTHFGIKYPALGRYRATINWQQGTMSVAAAPIPHDLKLLFVGYNPSDGTTTMADRYFGGYYGGLTADQAEDQTINLEIAAFNRLSAGRIRHTVVAKIHDRTFDPYPDGFTYTMDTYGPCTTYTPPSSCETRKWTFDYPRWIAENKICETANQYGVDAIWVESAPFVQAYESFMIGPTPGFDVNGPSFVTPTCNKHYTVQTVGYAGVPQPSMQTYGHSIEHTMGFITSNWQAADVAQHWERFAAMSRYSSPYGQTLPDLPNPYCGNAHFPSNAQSDYDFANPRYKDSNCVDWSNFPNYTGQTTSVTCSNWSCSDPGWGEFWFGAMPTGIGTVRMTSVNGKSFDFPRDWWNLLLSPDAALQFEAGL